MAISLRFVIVILILVVGVAIALSTILPLTTSANAAVEATIAGFRSESSRRITGAVRGFFASATDPILNFQSLFQLGIINGLLPNEQLLSLTPIFCSVGFRTNFSIYIGTERGGFVGCGPNDGVLWRNETLGNLTIHAVDLTNRSYMTANFSALTYSAKYDPRIRPWYPKLSSERSWSDLYVDAFPPPKAAASVGAPLFMYNRIVGAIGLDVVTTALVNYLTQVIVSPNSKVIIVEHSTGNLLAASYTRKSIIADGADNLRLRTVYETEDPIVNEVLRSPMGSWNATLRTVVIPVGGTYSTVISVPSSLFVGARVSSLSSSASVRVFLDMVVIDDSFGLNLRLILLIPDIDFNSDFVAATNTALIIAGCVLLFCVLAGGGTAYMLLTPLTQLADSMEVVESLNLAQLNAEGHAVETASGGDSNFAAPSLLSEVRKIQTKYRLLMGQLRRVCSFLPQTILAQLARDGPDPNEEDGGDVANPNAVSNPSGSDRRSDYSMEKRQRGGDAADDAVHHRRTSAVSSSNRSTDSSMPFEAFSRVEQLLALSSKRITLLAVNIRNFHTTTHSLSIEGISEALADFTLLVSTVAMECRGVVHLVHGDHAVLSFNASTRCLTHCEKALNAALCLAQRTTGTHVLTMGISTGLAICGQAGTDTFRHCTVIGPVFKNSFFLERLCKFYPSYLFPYFNASPEEQESGLSQHKDGTLLRLLIDRQTAEGAETTHFTRILDVIPSPVHKQLRPAVISVVHGRLNDGARLPSSREGPRVLRRDQKVINTNDTPSSDDEQQPSPAPRVSVTQESSEPHVPNQARGQSRRKPSRVSSSSSVDTEWMYALQQRQKSNPFAANNETFLLAAQCIQHRCSGGEEEQLALRTGGASTAAAFTAAMEDPDSDSDFANGGNHSPKSRREVSSLEGRSRPVDVTEAMIDAVELCAALPTRAAQFAADRIKTLVSATAVNDFNAYFGPLFNRTR